MRVLVVVLAAVAIAGSAAGVARAHGDPASEYLVDHSVFFPIRNPPPQAAQARLRALVDEAARRGYPVRLALIGSRFDLGTEVDVWGRPRAYAAALDADLAYYYAGPLLVVMPSGFGLSHPRHSTVGDLRALAVISIAPGPDGLAKAAERAVERLAAAHGVSVSPPEHVTTQAERDRRDRFVIVLAVGLALLAWLLGRRVLRRRSTVAA